ncbi:DUF6069 family protein [Luteimicrobium subarcticum]|uniref:Uncharacterized protein n=1 Tax=Luteimicrobium subarcticum TaxID=620910 RepID=A0A2M8WQM3_9MICO|nr:DUF6069 family protein [Luteimicrobium subarcticum]PJI93228.1 hypothetical protein CLV34_1793 [Luteimicrobium subarcticum]
MSQPYPPAEVPEDPGSDFTPATPTEPFDPKLTLDAGRFVAGALATALVAALVGLIGVIIIEGVFDQTMVPPPDLFSSGSHAATFAIDSALFALLASGVLALLVVSTPRPKRFFGWIMVLAIALVTLLPFAWTSHTDRAILTALVNFVMGVATWSLLAGVATRTIRPVTPPAPVRPARPEYPPSIPPGS